MDIIYQIRSMSAKSNINFQFIYTRAIKNDESGTGSNPELLVQLMHVESYEYYTKPTRLLPRYFSDYLPASAISLVANGKPIVSDICMTLQNMERRELRKDYFSQRMGVHPSLLKCIDTYTIGRVLTRNPTHHAMYSKIMHRQLNTMDVNEQWSGSDDRCPVCLTQREDWLHPLQCQSQDMVRVRERLISEMMESFDSFKTYPPLAEFIVEYLRNLHVHRLPFPPDSVDPKFMVEFQLAYEEQAVIGWDLFLRGFVSRRWRHLQHCFLLNEKTRDVHAVDKWTRNFIKAILDFNRKLWKERCDIVHAETNSRYEDRQRHEIWQLREYLLSHKNLIPHTDWHFLKKDNSFFFRDNLDNVLNWEKRMLISMTKHPIKHNRDIRTYMIPSNVPRPPKRRSSDTDTQNKNTNTQNKKTSTLQQATLNTYLHIPTSYGQRPISLKRNREDQSQSIENFEMLTYDEFRRKKKRIKRERRQANRMKRTNQDVSMPLLEQGHCETENDSSFKRHRMVSPRILHLPIFYDDLDKPIQITLRADSDVEHTNIFSPGSGH